VSETPCTFRAKAYPAAFAATPLKNSRFGLHRFARCSISVDAIRMAADATFMDETG
jgi:hypothetical protein